MYRKFFKRALDFFIALISLLILSPVFIVLIAAGAIAMRGNPFFVQLRPGRHGRIFRMIKFRTMSNAKGANGMLLPDGQRLNWYGRLLRKTSLDELGELLNILIGQMSLVGPRPLLIRDYVFMDDAVRRRHDVRGGLTGLAQVRGRNNITWEQKFEFDLEYTRRITFLNDLKIVFRTVLRVFSGKDVVRDGTDSDLDYGDYLLNKGAVSGEEYEEKQEQALRIESNFRRGRRSVESD